MDAKIVSDFARLRVLQAPSAAAAATAEDDAKSVPVPSTSSRSSVGGAMDTLAHDISAALEQDETEKAERRKSVAAASGDLAGEGGEDLCGPLPSSKAPPGSTPSRRRAWRRRCKSTSNLSSLAGGGDGGKGGNAANNSVAGQLTDDSTSSSEDDRTGGATSTTTTTTTTAVVELLSRDRGASSLQMSDSDDDWTPRRGQRNPAAAAAARTASVRAKDHTLRKKRGSNNLAAATAASKEDFIDRLPPPSSSSHSRRHQFLLPAESDSLAENNLSPSVRPSTKRKRKFKRMALDPEPGSSAMTVERTANRKSLPSTLGAPLVLSKRQKIRQKFDYGSGGGLVSTKQRQLSGPPSTSAAITVGKRKRSNREKSVEPDHLSASKAGSSHHHYRPPNNAPLNRKVVPMDGEDDEDMEMDEDEDRRSSSSLSSTEWDEEGDSDNPDSYHNSREADDEQSDWPGYYEGKRGQQASGGPSSASAAAAAASMASAALTDEEESEALSSLFLGGVGGDGDASMAAPMTATAHKAYLARMKRLAECVPGREIRAGARKLRNRQTAFTIKSSSSEQLSRFLQDPSRSEMRLTVLRPADRDKVVQMANLYSLSVRFEGASNHLLVLSKTGRTVRIKEFAVPTGAPAKKTPVEFKRRRRTPPNSPASLLDGAAAAASGATQPPSDLPGLVAAAVAASGTAVQGGEAASSDVSMQPSPEDGIVVGIVEVGGARPSPSSSSSVQNRSESPVMGASEPRVDKTKLSGSLSS